MKISGLQKFILRECHGLKGRISRNRFEKFYNSKKIPSKLEQIKIISKSIDRLINKGLLAGFGERTQFKWFIKEVRLTRNGRQLTKKLMGEQKELPFKKVRKKK